ncbi:regulator of G-protein signaling 17-like isoform X4 [Oncorhynchus keta]|uniref:regulator of G-protein signaling 17-like isoform X4 n=1 Tax=Oncorhynchus keta TaxID=8018 RepID=UPI00227A7E80|nr:regulator of G-protein signaling 17-like isoform X4 [Oncorhynchus keta]
MPRSLSGVDMRKRQQPHIEGRPQAPGHPRPNNCCMCWCGCCKCLWQPTLDEVVAWARSFELVMRSSEGREIFREFLRSEYSEENLLFWLACEELKKETDPTAIDEKARIIYEDYVSILSPKEVSLDSRVREGINLSLAEPNNVMYEEAQLQIYTLMHRDSYPRFLNSSVYRDLLDSKRSSCLDT